MLILAVDTSTQTGSLAVLRGARVEGVVSAKSDEGYATKLFRHLDMLLAEVGLELPEIDLFAVAAGPGSFTGLRVGLTAVKAWAEVYQKPIAAVSALQAVAAQAPLRDNAGLFAPLLDARRGQVFGGLYAAGEAGLLRRGDEVVMTLAEYLEELRARVKDEAPCFVTPAPGLFREGLKTSPFHACPLEEVSAVLAPAIGRLAFERSARGQLTDALRLDANYVRRSDAEMMRKSPDTAESPGVPRNELPLAGQRTGILVRALIGLDGQRVREIQQASPEAGAYRKSDHDSQEGRRVYEGWVVEFDGAVQGFIETRLMADEFEILDIAVELSERRKGLGSLLMEKAYLAARAARAKKIYLEVRSSNSGAVAFYKRHGFTEVGARKNYYKDPVEDALLLACDVVR